MHVARLCVNRTRGLTSAIKNPGAFRPSSCSFFDDKSSSTCWEKECVELLMREWGCGLRESNCPTKFVRVLHLVRHPLRVMQELMDKVCPGKKAKTAHPAFMQLAATYVDQNESQACLATVVEYSGALLKLKQFSTSSPLSATIIIDLVSTSSVHECSFPVFSPRFSPSKRFDERRPRATLLRRHWFWAKFRPNWQASKLCTVSFSTVGFSTSTTAS